MKSATQPVCVNDSWQTPRNARTLQAYMALRNQEIGARLRELRGQKPQTTVADELGVAERTLQNWEAGDAKPSYRNLQRLAAYFDVGEDYILTGEATAIVPNGKTPDLSRPAQQTTETALAEVLQAIMSQLAAQTEVLQDVKTVLVDVKAMLGKDTETATRMEAVSESLDVATEQLGAAVQRIVTTRKSAAPRRAPKAPKNAPSRTRQA